MSLMQEARLVADSVEYEMVDEIGDVLIRFADAVEGVDTLL